MSSRAKKKEEQRVQGEEAKRLGRAVEKELSLWLTKARLTANRAEEDEQGWDLFVQFPGTIEIAPLLDLAPASRSCLIQVKGTTNADGQVRLTLANALKLVNYPGPAFIFVAHVVGVDLAHVWLQHVDEPLVSRVLKRAAECINKKESSLNCIELALSMPAANSVSTEPEAVRAAIEREIGDDMYRYIERKKEWLADVGYGAHRKELTVAFGSGPASEHFDDLADFAIGLREELPVERLHVYDLRFGAQRFEKAISRPTLRFPEVPTGPELRLIIETDDESVELRCKSFVARALFPFLPPSHDKVRLQADHLGFVVGRDPENSELIKMHWSTSNLESGVSIANLDQAAAAAKALRLIRSGKARILFDRTKGGGIPLRANPSSHEGEGDPYPAAIEDLRTVVRVWDLAVGQKPILPDRLRAVAHSLRLLACVASQTDGEVSTGFGPDGLGVPLHVGEKYALLMSPGAVLGDALVVVVTAVVGTLEPSTEKPGSFQISARRLPLLSKRVTSTTSTVDIEAMHAEAKAALQRDGIQYIFRPE